MQVSFYLVKQENKRNKRDIKEIQYTDGVNQLDRMGNVLQKYINENFKKFTDIYEEDGEINTKDYSAWTEMFKEISKDPKLKNKDFLFYVAYAWSNSIGDVMLNKITKKNSKGVVYTAIMDYIELSWKDIKKDYKYMNSPEDFKVFFEDLDSWTNLYVWNVEEIKKLSEFNNA